MEFRDSGGRRVVNEDCICETHVLQTLQLEAAGFVITGFGYKGRCKDGKTQKTFPPLYEFKNDFKQRCAVPIGGQAECTC